MAALVVGGLVVWGVMRPAPQPPAPIARFLIPLGAGEVFAGTNDPIVALSPAGTHVGYTANDGLVLRTLDQLEARPISGTLGALNPFFSPDGQQLGFYAPGVRLEPRRRWPTGPCYWMTIVPCSDVFLL